MCLQQHGTTQFSTYQHRTQVIDYILADQQLITSTLAIGYEPFGLHILSNHCGIFMDIATAQCFGSNTTPLQPLQLRGLSTKRSHQIVPYFQTKRKHLDDHNWFEKLEEVREGIKQNTPNNALAKDLYKQIIAALIHAGGHTEEVSTSTLLTHHCKTTQYPQTAKTGSYSVQNSQRHVREYCVN